MGEGTDPGIVGPDAHTVSERGHSHPLKQKRHKIVLMKLYANLNIHLEQE